MAVVSPAVSVIAPHQAAGGVDRIALRGIRAIPAMMASEREIPVEKVPEPAAEDKVYVAVSNKEVKESELTLVWALQRFRDKKICLVSVLVPPKMIPMEGLGAKLPASSVTGAKMRAQKETERKNMHSTLGEYLAICDRMGVHAEKELIESDNIEQRLVEFISSHGVKKLVMGAAADKRYYKKMTDLKSPKAIYVKDEAPSSCQIWFVCNGHLIHTRKARAEQSVLIPDTPMSPSPPHRISPPDSGQSTFSKSPSSAALRRNDASKLTNPFQDVLRRAFSSSSSNSDKRLGTSTVPPLQESTPEQQPPPEQIMVLERETNYPESSKSTAKSPSSQWSLVPPFSPSVLSESSACDLSSDLPHANITNDRSDRLEHARAQAENAIRGAFQEGEKQAKAEKEIVETAIAEMLKTFEILFAEEQKLRKEIEDELEKTMNQRDELTKALRIALAQKSLFENQIEEKDQSIMELEQKMAEGAQLLHSYEQQRDKAVREAEDLRSRLEDPSSATMPMVFSEFSVSEIKEATRNFHPSYMIGAGGYGDVYKCLLRHVPVAIKKLRMNSTQGPQEFEQEVNVLSKVRHPNIVTLIGACPEECILVYEHLSKGSLEDRLNCHDNVAPLTWQVRVRIATEVCLVLVFLHSSKPYKIVHGDLKPSNILLDGNLVSKLSDFGTCCFLSGEERSSNNTTLLYKSKAKVTLAYMDPEFVSTGEMTTKFDVYSFGIILLQLLTGKAAMGITKEVQHALSRGNLRALLDSSAGEWPHPVAEELARQGLKCCELSRRNRPDLQDVLRILQHVRTS